MSTNSGSSRPGLLAALVLLVLAAVGAVVFFNFRTSARVAAVTKGKAVNTVTGSITVRAEYEQPVVSDVGGRVISDGFILDPGKPVKKGDVLARIDQVDLELDIENTEREYTAAKRRIEIGSAIELERQSAKETLEQAERYAQLGTVSPADLIRQRRSYQAIVQRVENEKVTNQQTIDGYENALKIKRRMLEKMTIVARFDGIVSEAPVHPGALINANSTIATLITNSRVVEAKISQENFADIKLGQKATVRFLGHEENTYEAVISKILPTADADTQRNLVHLELKAPAELLVPGLTGEVSIIVGERDAQALVPRRALFGTSVFVVNDGRVEQRRVEVGYIGLNLAEITKGLTAGEQVIVEDLDRFTNGVRVKAELVK